LGTREKWGLDKLESECPIPSSSHNSHPVWEYRMKLPTFQKYLKPGSVLEFHNFKILSTLSISKCYPSSKILKHCEGQIKSICGLLHPARGHFPTLVYTPSSAFPRRVPQKPCPTG